MNLVVGNCRSDGFLERSCSVYRNLMLELELFMVLNVCNSSTRGREQKFKAILSYIKGLRPG